MLWQLKRNYEIILKMYSVIIILYAAVLAVAKGEVTSVTTRGYSSNLVTRVGDYINMNRLQYAKMVQDYDTEMDKFKEYYSGRVDGVNVQLNMISASIVQMEERLNPLELLSDFSKQCVIKYRSSIPTVTTTKTTINSCVLEASNQLTSLLSSALNTKNLLQNYYTNYFEKEILNCGNKFVNTSVNYTDCATAVTSNTNTYTINNQNTFHIQMDAAECTAKANIKRALNCCYQVQTRTMSSIAEADVLIKNCLLGKDECKPCNQCFTCPESYDLKVDYKNKTISNPLYERQNHTGCLMLNIH